MNKYSFQGYREEKMANAIGKDLGISAKNAREVCEFIKGKKTSRAKQMLNDVLKKKIAVPYKRAFKDIAHKPGAGMATGKYPEKVCNAIIKLIESVENNAQSKGLNINELIITHIKADLASRPWHYGRQRRRRMKRTHVEIIVEEKQQKEKTTTKTESKTKDKKTNKIEEEKTIKKEATPPKKEVKKVEPIQEENKDISQKPITDNDIKKTEKIVEQIQKKQIKKTIQEENKK